MFAQSLSHSKLIKCTEDLFQSELTAIIKKLMSSNDTFNDSECGSHYTS